MFIYYDIHLLQSYALVQTRVNDRESYNWKVRLDDQNSWSKLPYKLWSYMLFWVYLGDSNGTETYTTNSL